MLSEQQRRAYLQSMGIECLVPRLRLPGAKLSVLGEPEPESDARLASSVAQTAAPPSPTAPLSQSAAATVKDLLGNLETGGRPGAATKSQATVARPAAEPSMTRFALSVVRAGGIVLVDEGLNAGDDPDLYLALIKNLLFAVGFAPAELAVEAFIWPLSRLRGGRVDQSESAAREVLLAYLGKQLQQSSAQYLLIMGSTGERFIAPPGGGGNALADDSRLAVKTLYTASARQALSDPRTKAELWQQLQPLVNALRAAS